MCKERDLFNMLMMVHTRNCSYLQTQTGRGVAQKQGRGSGLTGFGSKPREEIGFGSEPREEIGFGFKPRVEIGFGSEPQEKIGFGSEPREEIGFGSNLE